MELNDCPNGFDDSPELTGTWNGRAVEGHHSSAYGVVFFYCDTGEEVELTVEELEQLLAGCHGLEEQKMISRISGSVHEMNVGKRTSGKNVVKFEVAGIDARATALDEPQTVPILVSVNVAAGQVTISSGAVGLLCDADDVTIKAYESNDHWPEDPSVPLFVIEVDQVVIRLSAEGYLFLRDQPELKGLFEG